jgi:xanthine/uracil permease
LFFIAFAGAPLPPKIAVTVMALIALRVRDAYGHYLVGSAGGAATDGLVMTAIVALSQVYLLRAYRPAVMPALSMVQGIALGMLLVAFWRLFCRLQTPFHNPQKRSEFRIFSSTRSFYVLRGVCDVAHGRH